MPERTEVEILTMLFLDKQTLREELSLSDQLQLAPLFTVWSELREIQNDIEDLIWWQPHG